MGIVTDRAGSAGDWPVDEILGKLANLVLVTEETRIHVRVHSRLFPGQIWLQSMAIRTQFPVVGHMASELIADERMAGRAPIGILEKA